MKKLLVLGASEFQIPLLVQAKKMHLYTVVIDINAKAKGFSYADEHYVCSIKDKEKLLEIAQKIMPDGITAGMCDVAVYTVSYLCNKLNLPGLNLRVAKQATDKYQMIEVFNRNNIPHPFYKFVSKNDFDLNNIEMIYPAISKPIDMAGSRGINYIGSDEDLYNAVMDSIEISDSGKVLIEEFMEGPEVSVEILVKGDIPYVLQVTDKITSGRPHFMELGHSQPSFLDAHLIQDIKEVATNAVKSLELQNCIVHAELIVTNEGPKMVELGARMGGDGIHQYLIELSTGINLQEIAIAIALGYSFEVPSKNINKASAIRFIQSKPGRIDKVNVMNDIDKENVKKVAINCKEGDIYTKAKDNSGRLGYVITQADNVSEAIEECNKAIHKVEIKWSDELEVFLKGSQLSDFEDYYNIRCERSDIYWMGHKDKPNYNMIKKCFSERLSDSEFCDVGDKKIFMVMLKSIEDVVVGYIQLTINKDGIEIGTGLSENFQGMHIGTKAYSLALKQAKMYSQKIFSKEIYSKVRDDNYASQKMCLKNGLIKTEEYENKEYPIAGIVKFRKYVLNDK